jgi:hypothetical protein
MAATTDEPPSRARDLFFKRDLLARLTRVTRTGVERARPASGVRVLGVERAWRGPWHTHVARGSCTYVCAGPEVGLDSKLGPE